LRCIILATIAVVVCSCNLTGMRAAPDLPPVDRLSNVGGYSVVVDGPSGREGEYAVPYLDGPHPSVVLVNDGTFEEDQVKEEARLLARHGFATLSYAAVGEDIVRDYARAGSTIITQPGARSAEAALLVLAGELGPALDVQRRLSGYRLVVFVDPAEPPNMETFVDVTNPIVVLFRQETPEPVLEQWRDALTLVSAPTRIVLPPANETVIANGILAPSQRAELAGILREILQ